MSKRPKYSAAVLAGGLSKRFGVPKAKVLFRGKELIQVVMDAVAPEADELFIIANEPSYGKYGVPVYPDSLPSCGPLVGLASALKNARYEYCFLLACDLPFLQKELFEELKKYNEYEAVVPRHGAHIEPLAALYKKTTRALLEEQIAAGHYKMQDAIEKMNYHYLQTEDCKSLTPDLFINLNTPEELKKWE